jgi:hypothetical protein
MWRIALSLLVQRLLSLWMGQQLLWLTWTWLLKRDFRAWHWNGEE